jgi:hypothetical protein
MKGRHGLTIKGGRKLSNKGFLWGGAGPSKTAGTRSGESHFRQRNKREEARGLAQPKEEEDRLLCMIWLSLYFGIRKGSGVRPFREPCSCQNTCLIFSSTLLLYIHFVEHSLSHIFFHFTTPSHIFFYYRSFDSISVFHFTTLHLVHYIYYRSFDYDYRLLLWLRLQKALKNPECGERVVDGKLDRCAFKPSILFPFVLSQSLFSYISEFISKAYEK